MWPFSLPFAADREEWEQEAQVALGMRKVLQSLGHATEKLRQAIDRLQGQKEEMWLQQNRNQSPQMRNRPRKVRLGGWQEEPPGMSTSSQVIRCGSSRQLNTQGEVGPRSSGLAAKGTGGRRKKLHFNLGIMLPVF